MAYLEVSIKDSECTRFPLNKRLTSVGSGEEADIILRDADLSPIAFYVSQSSNKFDIIIPAEKPPAKIKDLPCRNYRLSEGLNFDLAKASFVFYGGEPKEKVLIPDSHNIQVLAYRRLLSFSERVAMEKDIEALLATLLKEITQLTGAEHGFLVLMEEGLLRVKVHESNSYDEALKQLSPMSDSIVKKVIEKKEAIIISDALNDTEFSSSFSVINYRLSSVMCVPLIYQGHTFGAIYVGNNSYTNVFDKDKLELMTIYSSQAALLVQNALHIKALKNRTKKLQESLELTKFGGIIGGCRGMQQVFLQMEKVADTDINVLICGESGTGKELIARELHSRSHRQAGPFIVMNCQALAPDLLERELFGHFRGTFNQAVQNRHGKFQSANRGTLYLDEISEMPLNLQIRLQQALQDLKVNALDVRVIAASSRDLLSLVKNNEFREDLFYHLNDVQIHVPPLKERGNDVLVIANFFLQKYTKVYGRQIIGIEEEAQNALLNYSWPGNVRQLENRIRRAVVMCDHQRISINDLDIEASNQSSIMSLADAIERYRNRYIDESLERNAGNRTKAASELGVDPRTIFRHLESKRKVQEDSL
jgi:transcriptional regulator with GAF, ATPase, and Fis domain